MNKTNILSYILDEVALKARNVSTNMRKRIHYMLKLRKIILKEYDTRALMLNEWVAVGKFGLKISEVEEMKKGVSNYWLETQEQLDKLLSLNNEIRCHRIDFNPTSPIEFESIEWIFIKQDTYDINSKCSFNQAKELVLSALSTDQIKFILSRFKTIKNLRISESSLESIDFSQFKIKEFRFESVSFKESVYLPREIGQLQLNESKSISLVKAQRVNQFNLSANDTDDKEEYTELTKTLKGVKVAHILSSMIKCLTCLPSTVREIYIFHYYYEVENLEEIAKHFRYLIKLQQQFPIETLNKTNLRVIDPIMSRNDEKFKLRPRRIEVTSENAVELSKHPELFEKVQIVVIGTDKFNLDVLSSEIKKVYINEKVNIESVTLNRLKK